ALPAPLREGDGFDRHILRDAKERTLGENEKARLPQPAAIVAEALHRHIGLEAVAGLAVAAMVRTLFRAFAIRIAVMKDHDGPITLDLRVARHGLDLKRIFAMAERPLAADNDLAM